MKENITEYIVRETSYPDATKQKVIMELVRCKDCKHFKRDIPCVGGTYNGCDQLEGRDGCELDVGEDFFCAYGERRTERRSQ